MELVNVLNDRFGASLGRPNGSDPRFAWKKSSDLFYYWRDNPSEDWQKRSWADRIGVVWVLAEWRPPEVYIFGVLSEITREQWFAMFGWSRPYPQGGEYKPYAETALLRPPTSEDTDFYIKTLQQQLAEVEQANKDQLMGRKDATTENCEKEAQANMDKHEQDFMDKVADWEPLSWKLGEPRDPGDQDGALSFGGVGDSPALKKESVIITP